jgi:hypothetical protein
LEFLRFPGGEDKMRKLLLFIMAIIIAILPSFAAAGTAYAAQYIEGYFMGISEGKVHIEEYDGTMHTLALSPTAYFAIDQRTVAIEDFKQGIEVYVESNGRNISFMEGYSTEIPGYIPEGSKVRSGIIKNIDRDQLTVKLATGDEETYFTSAMTIALKNGVNVPLSTLYEGDRVKLLFDEADSTMISRLLIEGNSVMVQDIYRGKLNMAGYLEDTVTLVDVQALKNGKWVDLESSMTIPYSSEAPLHIGGMKIPYRNLKYYSGRTVYMAVKNFFGSSKIEKMVLKNQYESVYSDKIEEINWFTGIFELSNYKNITFNDGTIVVKNGRLVDQYAINPGTNAFIVADGRGNELMAGVVYIYDEDLNNSNIGQNYIYAGRLDEVVDGTIQLKNFFLMNRNDWESFDRTKELYYDNDTDIFDLDNKTKITPKEFYSGDYSVDESTDYAKDNNLKDWYAYIYADGDRAAAIMVQKRIESLLGQRVTNGTVENISEDELVGWTLELKNAADWSGRKEKWIEKSASTRVNLEKAMIIKDGKMIQADEIKTGDRLYIVRNGFEAKVVVVK